MLRHQPVKRLTLLAADRDGGARCRAPFVRAAKLATMLPRRGYGEYRLSCIEVQASVPAPGRYSAAGALYLVVEANVALPPH